MVQSAILHIDGDNFFAELFRLKDPKLRKRPVVIGHLKSRGSVVAASYEARHSGVSPGITMQQASRFCPDAALVQIDWHLVNQATSVLNSVLAKYSPAIEPVGADAAFLDYTGCHQLFGPAKDFAQNLQKSIYGEMSITASIGLSPDKAVSVVACRSAKLGSFQAVEPGEERAFLADCPLNWLPGIDSRLNQYFNQLGVTTIGDLARIPAGLLEFLLGNQGKVLALRAEGCEHARVRL